MATSLIILVNVVVFLFWTFLGAPDSVSQFMMDHFLVSGSALLEGRYWTLITSVFSHSAFLHLFINMYAFSGFGSVVETALGSRRFLGFYLVTGVISSISHVLVSAFILGQPQIPALGASGAVSGVILLFALLFPRQKVLIFGFIPMPAIFGALIFVGLDLWGLAAQAEGGGLPIGHGAHLGGALTGFVYYFFFLRKNRRTRSARFA